MLAEGTCNCPSGIKDFDELSENPEAGTEKAQEQTQELVTPLNGSVCLEWMVLHPANICVGQQTSGSTCAGFQSCGLKTRLKRVAEQWLGSGQKPPGLA